MKVSVISVPRLSRRTRPAYLPWSRLSSSKPLLFPLSKRQAFGVTTEPVTAVMALSRPPTAEQPVANPAHCLVVTRFANTISVISVFSSASTTWNGITPSGFVVVNCVVIWDASKPPANQSVQHCPLSFLNDTALSDTSRERVRSHLLRASSSAAGVVSSNTARHDQCFHRKH